MQNSKNIQYSKNIFKGIMKKNILENVEKDHFYSKKKNLYNE